MIYLSLFISLIGNIILIWYIRTLIKNYLFNALIVDKFKEMLENYSNSLQSIYKLEEIYGDETIKKAINETKFVIDACEEFKGSFGQIDSEEGDFRAEDRESQEDQKTIKIKEGEKISQSASEYKRIIIE